MTGGFLDKLMAILVLSSLAGCGWISGGTVSLTSSSKSDGGSVNATPSVAELTVESTRTSPATIGFTLTDNESNPVDVVLSYAIGGGPQQTVRLDDEPGLSQLATSSAGVRHQRSWDFASQLGSEFREDVTFQVEIVSEAGRGELGNKISRSVSSDLGNDAPEIRDVIVPASEIVGIALIDMIVSDSSGDLVTVDVGYDILGDDPDLGYLPASVAGQATRQLVASPEGTPFSFFWDVVKDVGFTELDIALHLTPHDSDAIGTIVDASARLDNNTAPIAILNTENFLLNPDRSGGVPISFRVIDGDTDTGEPADDLLLVFQWRSEAGSFPPLPEGAELLEALADPVRRRELQIATELPRTLGGLADFAPDLPDDSQWARLPELAGPAASLIRTGEEGLTLGAELEILRDPLVRRWGFSRVTLESPIGVVPFGENVLILDAPGAGGWRLRELILSDGRFTGLEVSDSSAGPPSALAWEPGNGAVLIASSLAGSWQVQRADLESVTTLVTADGSTELETIRDILPLSREAALITVGSSLIRLEYRKGEAPRVFELFSPTTPRGPLQFPFGLAQDPIDPLRVYIAEQGADRVLSLHLDSLETRVVRVGQGALPAPTSIAIENGQRLLVVTDEDDGDGELELRALDLADASDLDANGAADRVAYAILPASGVTLPDGANGLTTGRAGLRLLALPAQGDLMVGGGIEQVRSIEEYRPESRAVRAEARFDPPFVPGGPSKRWRAAAKLPARFPAAPEGADGVFTWDSSDAPGGRVFIRLTPVDSEAGIDSSSRVAKEVLPVFGNSVVTLPSGDGPFDLAKGDLDGDGDLDLVVVSNISEDLHVFFQSGPGTFVAGPVLGDPVTTHGARAVAVGDLDQDGDLDILCAASGTALTGEGSSLTMFSQTSPGQFAMTDRFDLERGPVDVAVGDLDQDGDLDLAVSHPIQASVTLYFQSTPGVFVEGPSLMDDESTFIPIELRLGDLDGDGDLDLVVGSDLQLEDDDSYVRVFYQTAPGTFELGPALSSGEAFAVNTDLLVQDLDGDGRSDIVAADGTLGLLRIYYQDASGAFEPVETFRDLVAAASPVSLVSADIDGDADLDLVIGNSTDGGNVSVLLQTAPRELTPGPSIDRASSHPALVVDDFNGDGRQDIAFVDSIGDSVTVAFQTSLGQFNEGPKLGGPNFPSPTGVSLGDFDEDGDLDILPSGGNLQFFVNESPGVFAPGPKLTGSINPRQARLRDLNGDGDLDVVTADLGGNKMDVYLQTAPSEFTLRSFGDADTTPGPLALDIGDLDDDGDLDVVLATGSNNDLRVMLQTGIGIFTPGPVLGGEGITNAPLGVAIADLDGDADADIVSANSAGNNLQIFLQTSPGVFTPGPTLGSPLVSLSPQGVVAGDLDGDGDLDLACPNQSGSNIALFFQTAPGVFSSGTNIGGFTTTLGAAGLALADLDQDGDLDIVCANFLGNSRTVFFQIRPGVFRPGQSFQTPGTLDFPIAVTTGDLDSDGDLDFITADLLSDSYSIFWGAD